MFARLVSNIANALPSNKWIMGYNNGFARFFDLALGPNQCQRNFASKTKFFYITKPRYNFPRPSEYKRVTRLGWHARMSTPGGRKILMRRILKGKHVLCH